MTKRGPSRSVQSDQNQTNKTTLNIGKKDCMSGLQLDWWDIFPYET